MQVVLDPAVVHGATVTAADSARTLLGQVERVYLDADTGVPTWALVDGAGLGGHRCLVPLSAARLDGAVLRVPYSIAELAWAPHHDPGRELTAADERELDAYYQGLTTPPPTPKPTSRSASPGSRRPPTASTSPGNVEEEATVIRSEERLHVGIRTEQVGVARLRRYVTTETVTQVVPVTHEELVVDRHPITAAHLPEGAELGEQTRDVVLHADRVVTAKDTVPVEQIRLATRTVTEQRTITAQVARENVVFDGIDPTPASTTPRPHDSITIPEEGETA